jgi:hypothetical protein
MRLGGKVYNAVYLMFFYQLQYRFLRAYIAMRKNMAGVFHAVIEACKVPGICEQIKIYDSKFRFFAQQHSDEIHAYKTCSACN